MHNMDIYHYHPLFGICLGADLADDDPLEPGGSLVPAFATPRTPPDAPAGTVAVYLESDGAVPSSWTEGDWQVQPDFRNVPIFSITDGAPYTLGGRYLGIGLLPADATTEPRPSLAHFWSGAAWVLNLDEAARLSKAAATKERADRMEAARDAMVPLQLAAELGEATDAEAALLLAWKRYVVKLNRIDVGAADIQWPEMPAP